MNEHAKKIYTAFMDGKTVQRCLANEWRDENPFDCLPSGGPYRFPEIWRIKPNTEIRYYRVYRGRDSGLPKIYTEEIFLIPQYEFERKEWFGGWVGRTQSYEVEVEE